MAIQPLRPAWGGTMTDRERFNRQMHYQRVDRCVNREFGYWVENFDEWALFRNHGIVDNAAADRFFNIDPIPMLGANTWMNPRFEQKVIAETATTQIVQNGDGLRAEVPKDSHSTIPHYTDATIKTPADWEQVKAERFRRDDPERVPDIASLKRQHPADRTWALGISCGSMIGKIRDMLTFEGLAYAIYDYPEMVEDMVETACVLVEDALDRLLPHFDFDFAGGWEDICFKNGPIVSLSFFEDVLVPRYKRIGKKLRAHGVDIWYTDCDGDVRPLIPGFLEAGLNTMFPFEVSCSGHPGAVLDQYGEQLRIMGGVDKHVLARGKAEIRAYLESLAPYVHRGGFIPHCDHRCPPDVPEDNYLYYLDLKEELFGLQ